MGCDEFGHPSSGAAFPVRKEQLPRTRNTRIPTNNSALHALRVVSTTGGQARQTNDRCPYRVKSLQSRASVGDRLYRVLGDPECLGAVRDQVLSRVAPRDDRCVRRTVAATQSAKCERLVPVRPHVFRQIEENYEKLL